MGIAPRLSERPNADRRRAGMFPAVRVAELAELGPDELVALGLRDRAVQEGNLAKAAEHDRTLTTLRLDRALMSLRAFGLTGRR